MITAPQFIRSVLSCDISEWSLCKGHGLKPGIFAPPYDAVLHGIDQYIKKHDRIPTSDWITEEFPSLAEFIYGEEESELPLTLQFEKVRKEELQTQVRETLSGIIQDFKTGIKDPEILINEMRTKAATITAKFSHEEVTNQELNELAGYLLEHIDDVPYKHTCPTPFHFINDVTGGLHPGDLYVIAGPSGIGKSWVACQLALTSATGNPYIISRPLGAPELSAEECHLKARKTLIVSMEMSGGAIGQRLAGMLSGVSATKIKDRSWSDTEKAKYAKKLNELINITSPRDLGAMIRVLGPGDAYTVDDVEQLIKEHDAEHIIIDSFYEMDGEGEKRWEKVSDNIRKLRLMALRYGIIITVTTQLAADVTRFEDVVPNSLSYSKDIYRTATMLSVIMAAEEDDHCLKISGVIKARDSVIPPPVTIRWDHDIPEYTEIGPMNSQLNNIDL